MNVFSVDELEVEREKKLWADRAFLDRPPAEVRRTDGCNSLRNRKTEGTLEAMADQTLAPLGHRRRVSQSLA